MSGIRVNCKTGECETFDALPVVDPNKVARDAAEARCETVRASLKARKTGPVTREEFNDLLEHLGIL